MRILLTASFIALAAATAMAVPAKPGKHVMTDADGNQVTVTLHGDESFHYYLNASGQPMVAGEDGRLVAADPAMLQARAARAAKAPRRSPSARASQVPQSGSPRVPILLVQYTDKKFRNTDPNQTFVDFFRTGEKSALQYFTDQSNGQYTPQFDVYGPVTLSGTRATYGGNDSRGNDKGVGKMVAEGCQLLDGQIDYSLYDNDGDGECDVLVVLYAGEGEASSNVANAVWPCQWQLDYSEYGRAITLDGTKVNKFAVFNELNGEYTTKIDGVGTFCHEFSHCLDLPDFYDPGYGPRFGMGPWSLMDSGCYNDDGYNPIGYSAYEKAYMGWIEIPEATPNTLYTLDPQNGGLAPGQAVKITNAKDNNEYYILENRQKQSWDADMYSQGLMVTHVTYLGSAWMNNTVNAYNLQRMTIMPADGLLKVNTLSYYGQVYYQVDEDNCVGDLWPYKGADELTDASTPQAATVNTGGLMGKPVTAITQNADGTVSFWYCKAPVPPLATPAGLNHELTSTTSAMLRWAAVPADCDVTYTLEVRPHQEAPSVEVSTTNFSTANHGWVSEGYSVMTTSQAALLIGSKSKTGGVVSPAFDTQGYDQASIVLEVQKYDNNTSVKISLLKADADMTVLSTQTITAPDAFANITAVFDTEGEDKVRFRVETTGTSKRFYLRNATIYAGDCTVAAEAPRRAAASTLVYDGLTETSFHVEGLAENASYDYRVKATPADFEAYDLSNWSARNTFDLSEYDQDAIIAVEADDIASSLASSASLSSLARYYRLDGSEVSPSRLTPGIYLMRRGSETVKVLVR